MDGVSTNHRAAEHESHLGRVLRWLQGPAASATITAAFSQVLYGLLVATLGKPAWNRDLLVSLLAVAAFLIATFLQLRDAAEAKDIG